MSEREKLELRVRTWKEAGPELGAIRRKEIAELDTYAALEALEAALIKPYARCLRVHPREWWRCRLHSRSFGNRA